MEKIYGEYFFGYEDKEIFLYEWNQVDKPRGIVQIFHGMAEHAGRYNDFAKFLNENGFIVLADDHRGHGKTALKHNELGYLGDDGFYKIVEDEKRINEYIKNKYKGLPVIILGHSFGSFIGQEFLIRYSDYIDGIILSGSAARTGIDVKAGKSLAGVQKKILGKNKTAKLLDKISFSGYNRKVGNDTSKFAWLSRDKNQVNKYEEDDFCGMVCKVGFFHSFFEGVSNLYKKPRLQEIDKNMSVFIISGEDDPVGLYGKGVRKLFNIYKESGLNNVEIKLYKNARHEILNEINKQEVYDDILQKLIMWSNKDR